MDPLKSMQKWLREECTLNMAQHTLPVGWEELGPRVCLFLRLVTLLPSPFHSQPVLEGPLSFMVLSQLSVWDRVLQKAFAVNSLELC